jgi:hypothetical protein
LKNTLAGRGGGHNANDREMHGWLSIPAGKAIFAVKNEMILSELQ